MAQSVTLLDASDHFPGIEVRLATDTLYRNSIAANINESEFRLLPYSLLISNNTSKTIRAYTVKMAFKGPSGALGGRVRQYFNFERRSNGTEIEPGEVHFVNVLRSIKLRRVAPGASGLTSQPGEPPDELEKLLRSQATVVLSVDLVVLADGRILGANEAKTLSFLDQYLRSEREFAQTIQSQLKRGASVEQIRRNLEIEISARDDRERLGRFGTLARVNQARRFLRHAKASRESLVKETEKTLAKPEFILHW